MTIFVNVLLYDDVSDKRPIISQRNYLVADLKMCIYRMNLKHILLSLIQYNTVLDILKVNRLNPWLKYLKHEQGE